MRGREAAGLEKQLDALLQMLQQLMGSDAEPMVNIAAFHHDGQFTTLVFPRGKHRPSVYETGELTVSPAAIDLCGIFVVPVKDDFDRIRGSHIEQVLDEVTLPMDLFQALLGRIGRSS